MSGKSKYNTSSMTSQQLLKLTTVITHIYVRIGVGRLNLKYLLLFTCILTLSDREIATKMFRTISRGGQTDFTPARPSSKQYQDQVNQAPKKSTARVRVKSANLPSREKREAEIMFKKMPKFVYF